MYYRVERFYLNPLIWLLATHLRCHPPAPCAVAAQVWNTYYTIHPTSGTAFVLTATGLVLARQDVVFERYWQPTNVTLGMQPRSSVFFPFSRGLQCYSSHHRGVEMIRIIKYQLMDGQL